MASETITVKLKLEKETKNTVRFEEVNEPTEYPVLRNLYISKPEHAKLGSPAAIEIKISAAS